MEQLYGNIWNSSFSFFMPKQQPHFQSNFKKIAFSPSSYSDKMRLERGLPKQLFNEKDFSKDLTYSSKVKYIKIYPDIMIKTSRFHYWVNIQYWWLYRQICFSRLILPPAWITSQNPGSFREKYLQWSFVIVKPLPYVSETYDFIELYHDILRFMLDLADPGLFLTISQFKIYVKYLYSTFIIPLKCLYNTFTISIYYIQVKRFYLITLFHI